MWSSPLLLLLLQLLSRVCRSDHYLRRTVSSNVRFGVGLTLRVSILLLRTDTRYFSGDTGKDSDARELSRLARSEELPFLIFSEELNSSSTTTLGTPGV